MKVFNLLIISIGVLSCINSYAQDYPIDKRTNKICYTDTISVNANKEQLFKRAEQFIASQNFDRVENIRCKDKTFAAVQLMNKSVTYSDLDDGKIIGNGFVNFEYRGKERFIIIFKYKIGVKDNAYKYEITDFQVWEFVSAPKAKKGDKSVKDNQTVGLGSSSGFTVFSANDVRKWDLEEFVDKPAYDNGGSDEVFREKIKLLVGDLKVAMKDNF